MSRWKKGKLIDLININTNVKLTKGKKYPFVSMDVIQPFYKPVEAKEEREFISGGARFENGDTLFARITPCLENGKIAQVKNLRSGVGFGSTEFLVLRGKEGITDNDFVYYLSINRSFRENAERLMVGTSGRQRVDKQQFENLVITIPDIETQKRIASILSGIDSKIELNVKMNQTLEEMAMTLYKHRFVDFGSIQHGEFVESELGMIPKGWQVGSLSNIANILMGQSPKSEFYNQNGDGLPFHQGVKDFGDRFPSHVTYCTKELRVANAGEILVSVRAPVGRLNITDKKIIIGRGLAALSPKSDYYSFLLYTLKHLFAVEDQYGSGTVFNSITKKDLESLKVIIPDEKSIKEFEKKVSKYDALIAKQSKEIDLLIQARDYLLPRLLSGEIDVTKAEKEISEVL
ncbi:restriction endonuclease subunit S [Heyndrickxia oleronia]|jgi:type I restriction enzyme S subunit|uniref:restriction endonuclease subunit S n=1 Tax=Heyndrickxia oleronia TaxID=38875 RepID=UPI00243155CF|nr:restriction endonuclease subunit S [Heyndrickxia oleronia]MCI1593113.1 restriction endonuclease subunit S [Heyndrickxia oleronia]MCI1615740.1 restriction endonuclease subunit S [Heyndrickxia oleronia]MCI1746372.1 restriction endonuclease subunit S [Heyndrickxia oleronia]MCI1764062.1 restriction endonuclease subunit S [Heyndrickxia oleronia]